MKKWLVPLLKAGIAIAAIYYVIHTKKITAEPFIQLWSTPWLTFFVFGATLLAIVINNYRWLLLLRGQAIVSSVSQTLPLTFIGLFFNLAMPGSVGGDVVKAYYIAQDQPGTKLKAATSVLMDRIVGLYAMAIIAVVAVFFNSERIFQVAQLRILALFVIALVVGFTVFFILGFSSTIRGHALTDRFLNSIYGGKLIMRVYDAVHAFKNGKKQFAWGICLSILVQSMTILSFFIIARVLHFEQVSPQELLASLFFVIPLGLIATAVPLSPGGVGVGQVVFLKLFIWYGGVDPKVGPTLITIYQVVQSALSLIGAALYFMRKSNAQASSSAVLS
jgi:uncharacterized protein (TIRG00374 family)